MVEAEGPRKTLRDISVKATIVTPLLSGPQLSGHPPLSGHKVGPETNVLYFLL